MPTQHGLRTRIDVSDILLAALAASLLSPLPRQPLAGFRRPPNPRNHLMVEVLACGHEAMPGETDQIARWIAAGKVRPCPACARSRTPPASPETSGWLAQCAHDEYSEARLVG